MFLLFWNRKRSGAATAHSNAQRLLSTDIKHKLDVLHRDTMRYDISLMDMHAAYRKACDSQDNSQRGIILFFILLFIMIFTPIFFKIITFLLGVRCFLPNNNLVWEATRPVDCSFCRGVSEPLILQNLTREEFAAYAYSSQPIIIKNGCNHWRAANELTFDYLKELYTSIPGALDESCPFLHFRSNLKNLRDVFNMPNDRVNLTDDQQVPWFVGWSNCHPIVLEQLRKLYPRPHFLPRDAEMPKTDHIFLGYEHDAFMHLDYIPRLLWQAQLKGNKSWILAPTPECDHLCQSFSFYVEPGDAVLVDTRIWYHGTSIPKGQFSLTIQSEYG